VTRALCLTAFALAACHAKPFDRTAVLDESRALRLEAKWDAALRLVEPKPELPPADRGSLFPIPAECGLDSIPRRLMLR
jgi:hypothetical protein